MELAVNLGLCVLIAAMTYALASEGLWGAALIFFDVVFAGLIAFNFYEPLAAKIVETIPYLSGSADTLSLMVLFIVSFTLLRLATETLAPAMVRFPTPVYHIGRWFFALAASVVVTAILIVSYETAPVHKKLVGVVDYKFKPPFGFGLDHEWLGFFQYTTGQVFARYDSPTRDPFREYGTARVFDPRAMWLLDHQNNRPYGDESILEEEGGAAALAAGAAATGGVGVPKK